MRFLFLILVLVNAAAFAYIRYAESRSAVRDQIPLLQISPEKLKLLKPSVVPAADSSALSKLASVCLEWGTFAVEEAARAATALAGLGLGEKATQRDSGGDSYWVYIPPLKTRAEAEKKLVEVKALGLADFYIVPDTHPWRQAIALGAFKTEEAANTYLVQIRQKGVRSATVALHGATSSIFVVRDPGDEGAMKLAALKAEFPAATLKAVPCAEAAGGKG